MVVLAGSVSKEHDAVEYADFLDETFSMCEKNGTSSLDSCGCFTDDLSREKSSD